jgi:hypothetical protein
VSLTTPPILVLPIDDAGPQFGTKLLDTYAGFSAIGMDEVAATTCKAQAVKTGIGTYKRIASNGLWPYSSLSSLSSTCSSYWSGMSWGDDALLTSDGIFYNTGQRGGWYTFGSLWFWDELYGGPGSHGIDAANEIRWSIIHWKAIRDTAIELWQVSARDAATDVGTTVINWMDPNTPTSQSVGSDLSRIYTGTVTAGSQIELSFPSIAPVAPPAPALPADVTDGNNWAKVGALTYIAFT